MKAIYLNCVPDLILLAKFCLFTEILSGVCYNNNSKKEEDRKNKGRDMSFMWSDECSDINRCFAYLHHQYMY